jgi:UDP-N-acetylmuramyl pentapeptide phosphotransferase/UDP-N-acetylglucosamine-1-phosphate transferase
MKKIKDERLVLKNLQNVRTAYIIQTIGIIGILGYDLITKGMDGMRQNPLWIVFMITTIVSLYLSMNISVDHESSEKSPKKGTVLSLVILTGISVIIGIAVNFTDGFGMLDGLIIGGIIFVCGLIPILYIHQLRTKQQNLD